MNRRSILSLIGLAPIVAVAAAKTQKLSEAAPIKAEPGLSAITANIGSICAGRISSVDGCLVIDASRFVLTDGSSGAMPLVFNNGVLELRA